MLATICDDTWNVLNMRHITTKLKKDGIIQTSLVVAIKNLRTSPHGWSGHQLRKVSNPHPLQNPRSRSKLEHTYPFCSISISPHTHGIQLFQNLTLKIQSQGHGRGQSWKSQHGSNIQATHISFVPCQLGIPFLSYYFFKIWPWKSRVKVMGEVTVESHNVALTSYRPTSVLFHVNRSSHSWNTVFSKFDLENQGQGQMTMMLHNYRSR